MTFQEFLVKVGLSEFSFWGIVLFLASWGIELTPKIKWNPWTALFKWIGEKFNTHIDTKLETVREEIKTVDTKVTKVQTELTKHMAESEKKALQDTRNTILDFSNACMNGRRHTKEQYEFMINQCDKYEEYINKNKVKNGVIETAIKEIRRLYDERIHKNDFLKEGEDPEEYVRKEVVDRLVKELRDLYNECPVRKGNTTMKAKAKVIAAPNKTATTRKSTSTKTKTEGEA